MLNSELLAQKKNGLGPVKKDLNWSYRAREHLGTCVNTQMFPNVFEINDDKINEKMNVVSEFYAMFFLLIPKKYLWDH